MQIGSRDHHNMQHTSSRRSASSSLKTREASSSLKTSMRATWIGEEGRRPGLDLETCGRRCRRRQARRRRWMAAASSGQAAGGSATGGSAAAVAALLHLHFRGSTSASSPPVADLLSPSLLRRSVASRPLPSPSASSSRISRSRIRLPHRRPVAAPPPPPAHHLRPSRRPSSACVTYLFAALLSIHMLLLSPFSAVIEAYFLIAFHQCQV